jgi:hypothetical protein
MMSVLECFFLLYCLLLKTASDLLDGISHRTLTAVYSPAKYTLRALCAQCPLYRYTRVYLPNSYRFNQFNESFFSEHRREQQRRTRLA